MVHGATFYCLTCDEAKNYPAWGNKPLECNNKSIHAGSKTIGVDQKYCALQKANKNHLQWTHHSRCTDDLYCESYFPKHTRCHLTSGNCQNELGQNLLVFYS